MAELFRLVNYSNLPRMVFFEGILDDFPMDSEFFEVESGGIFAWILFLFEVESGGIFP